MSALQMSAPSAPFIRVGAVRARGCLADTGVRGELANRSGGSLIEFFAMTLAGNIKTGGKYRGAGQGKNACTPRARRHDWCLSWSRHATPLNKRKTPLDRSVVYASCAASTIGSSTE